MNAANKQKEMSGISENCLLLDTMILLTFVSFPPGPPVAGVYQSLGLSHLTMSGGYLSLCQGCSSLPTEHLLCQHQMLTGGRDLSVKRESNT